MSILDRVKQEALNQFIEVIEWLDDSGDTMVYRFPVAGQEIKNGAQLIVRESQAAVFVFEGQVADVFTPGRYTISVPGPADVWVLAGGYAPAVKRGASATADVAVVYALQ